MIFQMIYRNTGLRRMHSTDLADMRACVLGEDDDGPDGDSPFVRQVHVQVGPGACQKVSRN